MIYLDVFDLGDRISKIVVKNIGMKDLYTFDEVTIAIEQELDALDYEIEKLKDEIEDLKSDDSDILYEMSVDK